MSTVSNPVIARVADRITALSLAAIVSFALLGTMGSIANQQVSDVVMAQAAAASTQLVVVNGHHQPKG